MITVLCGQVAAGKTHLARLLERQGAAVLSCDELMLTVFDGCLGDAHDRTAMKCLTYLFSLAVQLDRLGQDVVLDYGFWLRAERDAARSCFTQAGAAWRMLHVTADEPVRLARLAHRNAALRGAPGRVYLIEGDLLTRMDAKFQPPLPAEGLIPFDNTTDLPEPGKESP